MQLAPGVGHHRDGKNAIYKPTQVNLRERNEKARIYWQEQQKIETAGANEFGKLREVRQENRGEYLLDEIARPDQQHDLPFAPVANVIGMAVNDADKSQLQREPEQLDHN